MQATKKPHNYHKTVVWQKDDRIRKSPLKFYVYYYSELSGDCQVSIFTELWRLSVAFLCYFMAHEHLLKEHTYLHVASGDTPILEYRRLRSYISKLVTSRFFQKWCSSGVVSALLLQRTTDFTGFFRTFRDIAVANKQYFYHLESTPSCPVSLFSLWSPPFCRTVTGTAGKAFMRFALCRIGSRPCE